MKQNIFFLATSFFLFLLYMVVVYTNYTIYTRMDALIEATTRIEATLDRLISEKSQPIKPGAPK